MSRQPQFPIEDKQRLVLSVLSGEMTGAEVDLTFGGIVDELDGDEFVVGQLSMVRCPNAVSGTLPTTS